MSLWTLIAIIGIGLVVLILVMFPEARSLFSGFGRLFIKDLATTPEGAEAIYGEKINEAQEAYAEADTAYKKAVGRLATAKRDLENLKSKLLKVESECESLVKAGKIDMAQLKAEEREEVISDIKRLSELVKAYEIAANTAKEAHQMCERRLRNLQKERKEVVENMKVKKQLKEIYDDMDELKNATGTDKLLQSVREKNKDLDSFVDGAKAVHDNKLSTRLQKAENEAKKTSSNDYLDGLKKKYNK